MAQRQGPLEHTWAASLFYRLCSSSLRQMILPFLTFVFLSVEWAQERLEGISEAVCESCLPGPAWSLGPWKEAALLGTPGMSCQVRAGWVWPVQHHPVLTPASLTSLSSL